MLSLSVFFVHCSFSSFIEKEVFFFYYRCSFFWFLLLILCICRFFLSCLLFFYEYLPNLYLISPLPGCIFLFSVFNVLYVVSFIGFIYSLLFIMFRIISVTRSFFLLSFSLRWFSLPMLPEFVFIETTLNFQFHTSYYICFNTFLYLLNHSGICYTAV